MPIVKFTPADILRSKILPAGWYGAKITSIAPWKESKDKGSSNMLFTFTIDNTDGKEIERYYNSKAISMMIPVVEAVKKVKLADKPEEFVFDSDELLNAQLDVYVAVEMFEGNPKNVVNQWAPYGLSKNISSY